MHTAYRHLSLSFEGAAENQILFKGGYPSFWDLPPPVFPGDISTKVLWNVLQFQYLLLSFLSLPYYHMVSLDFS